MEFSSLPFSMSRRRKKSGRRRKWKKVKERRGERKEFAGAKEIRDEKPNEIRLKGKGMK